VQFDETVHSRPLEVAESHLSSCIVEVDHRTQTVSVGMIQNLESDRLGQGLHESLSMCTEHGIMVEEVMNVLRKPYNVENSASQVIPSRMELVVSRP